MTYSKLFTSAIAAATLLLIAGCCKVQAPQTADGAAQIVKCQLTDLIWQLDLTSLAGVKAETEKPDKPVTLVLAPDGKIHGCAGVNNYFGTAEITESANQLKLNPTGCTMMAGPGLEYERAFLDMLPTVDSFEIAKAQLLLKSGDKTVAKFTAAPKLSKAD